MNLSDLIPQAPISGTELRALRAQLAELTGQAITQTDAALAMGTNQSTWSIWERAEVVPFAVAAAMQLAVEKAQRLPKKVRQPAPATTEG